MEGYVDLESKDRVERLWGEGRVVMEKSEVMRQTWNGNIVILG